MHFSTVQHCDRTVLTVWILVQGRSVAQRRDFVRMASGGSVAMASLIAMLAVLVLSVAPRAMSIENKCGACVVIAVSDVTAKHAIENELQRLFV